MQEDDLKSLGKIIGCLLTVGILILIFHCYWFCYPFFESLGLTNVFVNKIVIGLNSGLGLYDNILFGKVWALLFLFFYCLGTRGVKKEEMKMTTIIYCLIIGFFLYFLNWWILDVSTIDKSMRCSIYMLTLFGGYSSLLIGGVWIRRIINVDLMKDRFNVENESFMQETEKKENPDSINLPTKFTYLGKEQDGWINIVNPYRATIVLGTPGSGKTFAIINPYIKQQIEKGTAMYIYDYKFPALTEVAYNHLRKHSDGYEVSPKFYIINFDDPEKSHRCNPIHPSFLTDIMDAWEASYTIMLNLNRTWATKQGEFFVESPIILLAAVIWFLKIYKDGKYCTFPHAIEFLNQKYEDIFPILTAYPSLENYLSPFMDAWQGGAQDQLQGQIASAKIPLSRIISPELYWVMTGDDFTLDINNPKEPKILCVGNNPDRQSIYGAALGLYNSRIIKLINKQGKIKSSVIIDELPTIFFKGIDTLIATARSNKVAVTLGMQDFSQLKKDYGDDESRVVMNTVGNIFSGQVMGQSADDLSKRFGKVLQRRQSISINKNDTSTSISTQLDQLIPQSKISSLTQGMFVGGVADNFGEEIEQKFFHAKIIVDVEQVKKEEKAYEKIPIVTSFTSDGVNHKKEIIQQNYYNVKDDCKRIVISELIRIKKDPNLAHLVEDRDDIEAFEEYQEQLVQEELSLNNEDNFRETNIISNNEINNILTINRGDYIAISDFVSVLEEKGYEQSDKANVEGQYVIRKNSLDVFIPSNDYICRIDFNDDFIDDIRAIEIDKDLIIETKESLIIFSCKKDAAFNQNLEDSNESIDF